MSGANAWPPTRVPTLTEVIELSQTQPAVLLRPRSRVERTDFETDHDELDDDESGEDEADAGPLDPASFFAPSAAGSTSLPASPPISLSEEQLVERVMAELERQIDLMLEYRLREALAPLLARAADNLVRDARSELASTLRDVVGRAVAQEVARHRTR